MPCLGGQDGAAVNKEVTMRKIPAVSLPILFACLVSASTTGCGVSSSSSDGGTGGTGILNLAISDAPVDNAAALWLTLTRVTLDGVGGSPDQETFEIPEDRQNVNLMEYTGNSNAVLLQDLSVSEGSYKLRLDVDLTFTKSEQKSWIAFDARTDECAVPGVVWSEDMETCRYPLAIPSGEQSGFRPKGEILVSAGGVSDFTVEFDLRKNVVNPSNPADIAFKLKPTGLRLVDEAEAGSIAGAVVLDAGCSFENARVYLYDRTDEDGDFIPDDIHDHNTTYVTSVAVTEETVDGVSHYEYLIGFVSAGESYAVALTCEALDQPEVDEENFPFSSRADGIVVTANNETAQDLF
jgi:hypothetical protein